MQTITLSLGIPLTAIHHMIIRGMGRVTYLGGIMHLMRHAGDITENDNVLGEVGGMHQLVIY